MVRRPWIILVTLLILAILFSGVVTFRYLNRSNALRDRILDELSVVDGDFSLRSASVSPNSLILNGFSYTTADSAVTVFMKRLSVRASVANLVRHRDNLASVLHSISVSEPRVTFRPDRGGGGESSNKPLELPDLTDFELLERVILMNGSFVIETGSDTRWFEVHDVEGWVVGGQRREVELQLSASLAGDTLRALQVQGRGNLETPSMELSLNVDRFPLSSIVLPDHSPIQKLAGVMQASGRASLDTSGWDGHAQWSLEDAAVQIETSGGLTIDRINLNGQVEDKLATLDGSVRFEGDDARIDARLPLEGAPVLMASATAPRVHLGRHLGTFVGLTSDQQPQGLVWSKGDFQYNLSTRVMELEATATADTIRTPGGVFNDIQLAYSWDNQRSELRFDRVTADWYGLELEGNGRYRPSQTIPFLVTAQAEGLGNPTLLPKWASPVASKVVIGEVLVRQLRDEGFVISSDARVRDLGNPAFGEFTGRYSPLGYSAELSLYSLRRPDAGLSIQHRTDGPVHLSTIQPQLVLAWWDPEIEVSERFGELELSSRGKIERDTLITVTELADDVTGFSAQVNALTWLAGDTVEAEAGYSIRRMETFIGNGDLSGRYAEGRIQLDTLSFMDMVRARGAIDLREDTIDSMLVMVDEFELAYILPSLTSLKAADVGGTVNGRLFVDGPIANPSIESQLKLSGGRYKELDDYWGLLALSTDSRGELRVREGALGRQETTLFTLFGGYSPVEDSLSLYIESPGTDANAILNTLTGREQLLDGKVRLSGAVGGTLLRPNWTAELTMTDGSLAGIHFDDVSVDLRGETTDRLGHVIYVDRCEMLRAEDYTLTLSGAVPLTRGAGDVDLRLEGDLLSMLPQITPFITEGSGEGSLVWSTTIVAGEPVASRGSLTLNDGRMSFSDVFPDLTDLDIALRVDPGGRAHVDTALAVLDERYPVELTNTPADPSDSTRQAIRFGLPEVDFGVLKIRTLSDQGLPFHLPGISTTDEYAMLTLSGKQSDWLTMAGPANSLFIDGVVRLHTATFTYPPIVEEDESGILNAVLPQGLIFPEEEDRTGGASTPGFINNARWDVDAYIGYDVRYERIVRGLENAPFLETFSSFLGQIVLDLALEPTEPTRPIEISGQLADESFRLDGTIVSIEGRIEFLDLLFEMERAEVVFDPTSPYPVISMRAVTTIIEEDYTRQMFLTLYVIDPVTGERRQRGRWGEFTFVLEDDIGSSQEEVLSAMGVGITDMQQLQNRVLISGAGGIDRAVARRWLRPIEREAADWLGLDLVQVRPQFATNLIGTNPTDRWFAPDEASTDQRIAANTGTANLFRASRVVLGKYIDRDIFISYTGQFGEEARYASVDDIQLGRLGLLQKWNLEYRLQPISPNFVLEFGWEYENVEDRNNRSARMKYSVVFDLSEVNARNLGLWRL